MQTPQEYHKEAKTAVAENPAPALPPKSRDEPAAQMKIHIGNDVFIINHAYTGTHTIQEVYEDFLKRAISNC